MYHCLSRLPSATSGLSPFFIIVAFKAESQPSTKRKQLLPLYTIPWAVDGIRRKD